MMSFSTKVIMVVSLSVFVFSIIWTLEEHESKKKKIVESNEQITIYNKKVENVITNHQTTKEKAQKLEEVITGYFKTLKDVNKKDFNNIITSTSASKTDIITLLEYNILKSQEIFISPYGVETEKQMTKNDWKEHNKVYNSLYTVNYFMDDDTGLVEQVFIIKYGQSNGYFKINWLNGNIMNTEEFVGGVPTVESQE